MKKILVGCGLFVVLSIVVVVAGVAWAMYGSLTDWEGRQRFEVTSPGIFGEVNVQWVNDHTGPVHVGVLKVPLAGLPADLRKGQLIDCHVTLNKRPIVGGSLPSDVEDCKVVQ